MSTIHGTSWKALCYFRDEPAALAVYWTYCARTNKDNVAWPSLRGLAITTGWSATTCAKARKWLVEHKALELVADYIRPGQEQRDNLDRSEYYRPTGVLQMGDETLLLLYVGGNEIAEIDEKVPDVSPGNTSTDVLPRSTSNAVHQRPDDTELDTSSELDTSEPELDSQERTSALADADGAGASNGAKEKPPTPHAEMMDALVSAFSWDADTMNDNEWGQVAKASKLLRQSQVSPQEVAQLRSYCLAKFDIISPPGLANHVQDWRASDKAETVYANGMTASEADALAAAQVAAQQADAGAAAEFERIMEGMT